MRTAQLALAAALMLALTFGTTSAATAADTDDPLDLISPRPLDPVIGLLPPLPVKHAPYTGDVCPDGASSCIDETIAEMERRLSQSASRCDHDAVFDLAYLRVTEDVREAVNQGVFDDQVWLGQVDAVFASLYFEVMDAWHSGDTEARAEVPKAWQIALEAADDREMTGLGNFLLAMNAHINRDFSYVLAEVGLSDVDDTSHKKDHNAYNPQLDGLYDSVFAEVAARFDPTFDDIDVLTVEETVAGAIMRGWREMVWRNAEQLVLAQTPAQRRLAEQLIEDYAATQAQLIRTSFASPSEAATSARDAFCADHGTGG
ncbi:DUF5995 family protein [Aeromicrobium sp. CTD01-1L150]|uniref:DUF5995 family protein n=1 Tax=Aeromicrobium sp. CTD01-1L150 TaxID=3341830 RepID=UPI0035BF0274